MLTLLESIGIAPFDDARYVYDPADIDWRMIPGIFTIEINIAGSYMPNKMTASVLFCHMLENDEELESSAMIISYDDDGTVERSLINKNVFGNLGIDLKLDTDSDPSYYYTTSTAESQQILGALIDCFDSDEPSDIIPADSFADFNFVDLGDEPWPNMGNGGAIDCLLCDLMFEEDEVWSEELIQECLKEAIDESGEEYLLGLLEDFKTGAAESVMDAYELDDKTKKAIEASIRRMSMKIS